MKKLLLIAVGVILGSAFIGYVSAAPIANISRSYIPETDNTYYVGSSTPSNARPKALIVGTGTSTFAGGLGVASSSPMSTFSVVGDITQYGNYAHFGSVACKSTLHGIGQSIELCGDNNSDLLGVQFELQNNNAGNAAFAGITIQNDLATVDNNNNTHFYGAFINSSGYTSTGFGTGFANKNQAILQNTDGLLTLVSSTSTQALNPTGINFLTGGTATANERMRIDLNGNVGIGTTSPRSKLEVWSTGQAINIGDDTNTATNIMFAGSRAFVGYDGSNLLVQAGSGKAINFAVNSTTFNPGTSAMYISSAGNVGIGSTTPNNILAVKGNSLTSGTSTVGALIATSTLFVGNNSGTSLYVGGDNLRFGTTGSERVRIDSSGKVGIGTTSPYALLSLGNTVNGSTAVALSGGDTATILSTFNSSAAGSPQQFSISHNGAAVDISNVRNNLTLQTGANAGKVGIGTTSPISTLTVLDTGSNPGISFHQRSSNTTPSEMTMRKARGTAAAPTIVSNGDGIGRLSFAGYDGNDFKDAGRIDVTSSAAPGLLDMPGDMAFSTTADGASTPTERMRITNAGNVGIGTTSPSTKLQLTGVNVGLTLGGSSATTGSGAWMQFLDETTNTNRGYIGWDNGSLTTGAAITDLTLRSAGALRLNTGGNNTRIYINSSGNFGIGTTTPASILSIQGVGNFYAVAATSTLYQALKVAQLQATSSVILSGIDANAATEDALCRNATTGSVHFNTGAPTCTVSAARFKTDIKPLESYLALLLQFRPVSFTMKGTSERHVGFIAEDVEKIDSRLTFRGDDGLLRGVRYENITAVITKAVQELYGDFQKIVARVSGLEKKVDSQQKQIEDLQTKNAEFETRLQRLENRKK